MISQNTGPSSKVQTPFDSHLRELTEQDVKFELEVIDDVTGQVRHVICQVGSCQSRNVRLFGLDDIADRNIDVKRKQNQ